MMKQSCIFLRFLACIAYLYLLAACSGESSGNSSNSAFNADTPDRSPDPFSIERLKPDNTGSLTLTIGDQSDLFSLTTVDEPVPPAVPTLQSLKSEYPINEIITLQFTGVDFGNGDKIVILPEYETLPACVELNNTVQASNNQWRLLTSSDTENQVVTDALQPSLYKTMVLDDLCNVKADATFSVVGLNIAKSDYNFGEGIYIGYHFNNPVTGRLIAFHKDYTPNFSCNNTNGVIDNVLHWSTGVVTIYPIIPDTLPPEMVFSIDTNTLAPGSYTLALMTNDSNCSWESIPKIEFTVLLNGRSENLSTIQDTFCPSLKNAGEPMPTVAIIDFNRGEFFLGARPNCSKIEYVVTTGNSTASKINYYANGMDGKNGVEGTFLGHKIVSAIHPIGSDTYSASERWYAK